MKQPELGLRISEIRKQKGFTQEELVEKCNINVRTIQRIEAGEVMPRSYTIKTILNALEVDFDQITSITHLESNLRNFMMLDLKDDASVQSLIRNLNIAWIFGVIYFIFSFIEYIADYFRFFENEFIFSTTTYTIVKLASTVFYIIFFRGYIATGAIFKNHLLRTTAFMMLFAYVLSTIYDISSIYFIQDNVELSMAMKSFCFGTIGILLGIAILKLRRQLGIIAPITGALEIITGIFSVTVVLAFIGLFFLNMAQISGIIMLYMVVEFIKKKRAAIAS
ncbi:helix-turn-helix domain-containing protein [Ascidiimonas sp. W6]|uniref:helix-turn-helix domain-containing protein n=1 Tax=Ascidiimonas meishanensis TaxID=3128903 RepID=UPI0030EF66FB